MAILPPLFASAGPSVAGLDSPDWRAVGLVMSILGSFLLANAILFRHPRTMVAELFRGEKRELHPIREYIFHRVQVSLGFLYLLAGFVLQLYGMYATSAGGAATREFPTSWVGIVLLSALALVMLGWWLSHALVRHYVRTYLTNHPFEFETEVKLAREVGELLGLETQGDETVQSYVARLRTRLGLVEPRGHAARSGGASRREERRRGRGRAKVEPENDPESDAEGDEEEVETAFEQQQGLA